MSSQPGNVKKKGPPKYQNKRAFKNVYHDTSKRTKDIVSTEVSGVCQRCKDAIDWKIKYKKYKPLTQAKTCATCKQKRITQAYHTYCIPCSTEADKCAKCGEKKELVMDRKASAADQAREDRQLQFELEMLPERKRRTFLRLQEKGELTPEKMAEMLESAGGLDDLDDLDSDLGSDPDDEDGDEEGEERVGDNSDKDSADVRQETHKMKLGDGT